MKEPYMKVVAEHHGPESCAGGRESAREALTGGKRRPANELRNHTSGAPTICAEWEGNTVNGVMSESYTGLAESEDPEHA
jgi:hypothetical protein